MREFLRIYRFVFSYLQPDWLRLAWFVACSLVATVVSVMIPRAIQFFVDRILPVQDGKLFLLLLLVIAVLVVVMLAANAAQNLLKRTLQERAAERLQLDLFRQLRALSVAYAERHPHGETLSLFHTDSAAVQQMFRQHVPNLVSQGLLLLVLLGYLCSVQPRFTLLILPCFLIYLLIGPYFEKKAAAYGKQAVGKRTAYNKNVYDTLAGLLELRAYAAEAWGRKRVRESLSDYQGTFRKQILFTYLKSTVRGLVMYFSLFLIVLVCAIQVRDGAMTVGEFVSYTIYFFIFMNTVLSLFTLLAEQRLLLFNAERLRGFLAQQPEVTEDETQRALPQVAGEIAFRGIRFTYAPDRPVLNGVSFSIKAGERVTLVGRSGSGKSTLLKLMGRFYDPQAGEILLDGVPLRRLPLQQVRESIGFVFQETYLFGTTIGENIRFGRPDATDAEVAEAARLARLDSFVETLPDGYQTEVGEKGMKLSGGQKQRIAIARLFLRDPKILLMDEATSALDFLHEAEVREALDNLFTGRTCITVTHRYHSIRPAERVIVLERGQLIEQGECQTLLASGTAFRTLANGGDETHG